MADVRFEIRTVLDLGVPSGIQMIVIYGGTAVILSMVSSFGVGVVAGFGTAQRLDSIILLPALALGTAVDAMAAQNIGAKQWTRVAHITRTGVARLGRCAAVQTGSRLGLAPPRRAQSW